ncbi:hypothetical protein SAMD00019534_075050, partial [Acytostelium subglobosum LB1]|uniref:hypothetical protein n=1 Tax=Acytostelium subglobosum LB1 TaxID=1410327 RepID=UPI000644B7A3
MKLIISCILIVALFHLASAKRSNNIPTCRDLGEDECRASDSCFLAKGKECCGSVQVDCLRVPPTLCNTNATRLRWCTMGKKNQIFEYFANHIDCLPENNRDFFIPNDKTCKDIKGCPDKFKCLDPNPKEDIRCKNKNGSMCCNYKSMCVYTGISATAGTPTTTIPTIDSSSAPTIDPILSINISTSTTPVSKPTPLIPPASTPATKPAVPITKPAVPKSTPKPATKPSSPFKITPLNPKSSTPAASTDPAAGSASGTPIVIPASAQPGSSEAPEPKSSAAPSTTPASEAPASETTSEAPASETTSEEPISEAPTSEATSEAPISEAPTSEATSEAPASETTSEAPTSEATSEAPTSDTAASDTTAQDSAGASESF